MDNFLPEDYKSPESKSDFLKFKQGENNIRILGSAVVGYEYWTKENKPVRSKRAFDDVPEDAKLNNGEFAPKYFWAFPCWNYEEQRLQVAEITQVSIQKQIEGYIKDKRWGDPKKYDLVIERAGEGLDTEYKVRAIPPSSIELSTADQIKLNKVKLDNLFDGKYPWDK